MDKNFIASAVIDDGSDVVYVADTATYELYFLNHPVLELLGLKDKNQWFGQPCFKILQNRDEPCDFCTNHLLTDRDFYVWEHYNKMMGRYFTIKDKLIHLDGKVMRLEIATDVTEREMAAKHLRQKLNTEETLIACIQTMRRNADVNKAINSLLKIIGNYHDADRAYIFELDYSCNIMRNTYEWCREGTEPQIDNLQSIPLEAAERWFVQFRQVGEFYINSLDENVDHQSDEYEILNAQGIDSLMAAPLYEEDKIVGFLGVDNPRCNTDDMTLMRSVSVFIVDDLGKRRLMDELKFLSYTDSLTGIGNRHSYNQTVINLEKQPPSELGIVFMDINGLKLVNDTYGHQQGDYLIKHVATALKGIFGNKIYRIGGDEFIVLCDNVAKDEFEANVSQLRSEVKIDPQLQISVGAKWCGDTIDVRRQIEYTDDLMYIDKQKYYGMRLDGQGKYNANLARKLLREIRDGQFQVYLQPQMELNTGQVKSAEALVRRIAKDGTIELPAAFIPRYEEIGIVRHVDFFVLETVCATLRQWEKECGRPISISSNFSRITLMEDDVVGKMLEICRRYDANPENIVIEITESIGSLDKEVIVRLMKDMTKAGFHISLDDFGSGYSNLAMLCAMGFHEIKLDKSLISSLEANDKSRVVTEYTIRMCKNLGLNVSVGEGIETYEQRNLLKEFDCTLGQGYYFDKPMPIKDFEEKYVFNKK